MDQRSFDAGSKRQSENHSRLWQRILRKTASLLMLAVFMSILVLQVAGQNTDPPWSSPGNGVVANQVVLANQFVKGAQ